MITMTYDLALAIAHEAANVQMRTEGRTAWNEDDYNLAVRRLNELYPGPNAPKGEAT